MGKLIVLEGLDGSGKSTQLELLAKELEVKGVNYKTVSFPAYELASCAPVKMYLGGEFGTSPSDVNPYAASLLYAVDRFASYKKDWGADYNSNKLILAGRYVTSNAIHQASKLDKSEWETFVDWLYDLEYEKVGIPRPDLVIYLNVPVEASQKLLSGRYSGDDDKKDIHEKDVKYLNSCRTAASFIAEKSGWQVVECYKDGKMRSREDILKEILKIVDKVI